MRIARSLLSVLLLALGPVLALVHGSAAADEEWQSVAGPVAARIVRIIDGDTLVVDAHPWPGHAVRVSVRLRGIDTPERRSRCAGERLAADRALNELERLVSGFATVELTNVSGGKYYGRVLADLRAGTQDVATALLAGGLATPYDGGKRKPAICG